MQQLARLPAQKMSDGVWEGVQTYFLGPPFNFHHGKSTQQRRKNRGKKQVGAKKKKKSTEKLSVNCNTYTRAYKKQFQALTCSHLLLSLLIPYTFPYFRLCPLSARFFLGLLAHSPYHSSHHFSCKLRKLTFLFHLC